MTPEGEYSFDTIFTCYVFIDSPASSVVLSLVNCITLQLSNLEQLLVELSSLLLSPIQAINFVVCPNDPLDVAALLLMITVP